MTNELVVDVQPKEVSIALLEDKSLVELQSEGRNISFSVGTVSYTHLDVYKRQRHAIALDCTVDAAKQTQLEIPFKGNVDPDKLQKALTEYAERIR